MDTGDANLPTANRTDHKIPATYETNSFFCLTDKVDDPTNDITYTTLQPPVNKLLDVHNTANDTASEMTSDNDDDG